MNRPMLNRYFVEYMLDIDGFLDTAVEWIRDYLQPEDVFNQDTLADWAEDNGFIKEADDER